MMKRKLGILLVILGCGLLTAALALFLRNQQEQLRAASASQEAIAKVVEVIHENLRTEPEAEPDTAAEPTVPTLPEDRVMAEAEIDGYRYIGFLGIPYLELELPVMADWTYPQLQIAPCRYTGSIFTNDLVIMAHNYPKHFGKLRDLRPGSLVTFTDMEGETVEYVAVALDIMDATAIEDMTSGEYDLTLFTCTYGGENRVALRCDRKRNS